MTPAPNDTDDQRQTDAPPITPKQDKGVPDPHVSHEEHADELVDEGVDETFPASDPPASHQFT